MGKRIVKFPKLAAEMARNGETQEDLGKVLGLAGPSVCRRLSGEIDWGIGEIDIICEHYGKDFYQLFK